MIKMKYDLTTIYDVKRDVLVKRALHNVDITRADKLGISSDMLIDVPVIANNTVVMTQFNKIKINTSDKTLIMNLGNHIINTHIDQSINDTVLEFNPNLLISCICVHILNSWNSILLMYDSRTNTIMINKELATTSDIINTCLDIVIEYNKKNKISSNLFSIDKLLMGTDPEFLLTENNKLVSASTIIQTGNNLTSEVGCDGRSSTGEFRPGPHSSTAGLVKNMRNLYKQLSTTIDKSGRKNIMVMTGGGSELSESLGAHIHFSIPPSTSLIRMLDDFIGRPLKTVKGAKRSLEEYGILGDHRHQPHGFEYRTPPSFIGRPDIFAMTMETARCVALTWIDLYNDKRDEFKYNKNPTLTDYLNLSKADKYKAILTKFYNFITSDDSTLYVPNALAAWKITSQKVEIPKIKKTNISVIGNSDVNVAELARQINANGLVGTVPKRIYLYGINDHRGIVDILIAHNDSDTALPLDSQDIRNMYTDTLYDEYGFAPSCRDNYDILIGIPYSLRMDSRLVASTSALITTALSNILS